jgi:ligand-binding sensor domain-containing protein
MMLIRVICIRLFMLLLSGNSLVCAQELDYSYTHYDKRDGLPSNKIYFMCSDRDGFLWLGTDAGLCRFNGHEFKVFTTKDGLPSNDVFELYLDSRNRLWIVTMSNRICYYYKEKIYNSDNNSLLSNVKPHKRVRTLNEDKEGNIWIITSPFTIYHVGSNGEVNIHEIKNKAGVCSKIISTSKGMLCITDSASFVFKSIFKLRRTNFKGASKVNDLIIESDSLIYYSDSLNTLKSRTSSIYELDFYTYNSVHTIFRSQFNIWQLSPQGIRQFELNSLKLLNLLLKNYSVSNFAVDIYGNVWISTLYNGIFKLNSMSLRNLTASLNQPTNAIQSVFTNAKSLILGGTNGDLYFFDSQRKLKQKLRINTNALLSYRILKLIALANSDIIICTDIGLFRLTSGFNGIKITQVVNNSVKNLYPTEWGYYLLSSDAVLEYDKDFNLKEKEIRYERFYSYTLHRGQRYFGSESNLYILKDSLCPLKLNPNYEGRCMDLLSKDSLLYVATADRGVYIIRDSAIIYHLDVSNGLRSNTCIKMLPYKDDVFIATNNGISRYNIHRQSIFHLKESDGLASGNVHDIAIYNDTLYAATDNGLSVIAIDNFSPRSAFDFFISPLSFHAVTIWGVHDSISCHTDANLEVTLNALSLGVKGKVTFFYRIKELTKTFKSTNDSRVKVSLPAPGLYTFQAFAMDANHVKSKMAILNIVVQPYWWETNSFKGELLAMFLLIVGIVIAYVNRFSALREKIQNIKDQKIKRLELEAWKSNITPHFLFNSFNNIQSLFSSNQFEDANSFVSNFSGLLRKTIDNSSQLLNSFDEEVVYLTNYMQLERMKRNDKFSFSISVHDDIIRKYYLPSLILQPVIENSLKHGLNDSHDGYIGVNLKLVDDLIAVEIVDNGTGFSSDQYSEHTSKGIRMVRDKIRIVEGVFNKRIVFRSGNRFDSKGNIIGAFTEFLFPKLEQPGLREVKF